MVISMLGEEPRIMVNNLVSVKQVVSVKVMLVYISAYERECFGVGKRYFVRGKTEIFEARENRKLRKVSHNLKVYRFTLG